MADLYNQTTNLQAQGKFAPGVSYRADIRKPTQPIPNIPKQGASFNIDLGGIAEAISQGYQAKLKTDLASLSAKKTQDDKIAKATFLNNIASKLMKNETAADQGVYDTTTLDRMQRSVLDHALATGGSLGISANDIYALAPNYGPTTMQASKDRKDWHENQREEEQKLANDFIQKVPSAASLPYSSQVYAARSAKQAADAFVVSQELYNMNPNDEGNKMIFTDNAARIGDIQVQTTLNNMIGAVARGDISASDAQIQVRNSLLSSYSNLDPSLALYLTDQAMGRFSKDIKTTGEITKEEAQIVSNKKDMYLNQVFLNKVRDNPELAKGAAFGGDAFLMSKLLDMTPAIKLDKPIASEAYSIKSPDGSYVGVPQISYDLYSGGTTATGRHVTFDRALSRVEAEQQLTDVPMPLKFYNSTKMYGNTPNFDNAAISSIMYSSRASNVVGPNYTDLSPEDRATALANTQALNANTGEVTIQNLERSKQPGATEAITQVKQNRVNEKGAISLEDYGLVDNKEFNNAINDIKYSQYVINGLRISKQGDLLLQDDIQGGMNSIAQWWSGYQYKQNIQKVNDIMSSKGIDPESKRNIIEMKLGRHVEDWDGSEGFSTKPTKAEAITYNVNQIMGQTWGSIQNEVSKVFTDPDVKDAYNTLSKAFNVTFEVAKKQMLDYINKTSNTEETSSGVNKTSTVVEDTRETLPEWEERFSQMSSEFKEDWNKLTSKGKKELRDRYEAYRASFKEQPKEDQIVTTSAEITEAPKKSVAEATKEKIKEGIPAQIAAPIAAYETMDEKKKSKTIKVMSKILGESEEATKAGIDGAIEGVLVGAEGATAPFKPLGVAAAGLEQFINGEDMQNVLNEVGQQGGGQFNQFLTSALIDLYKTGEIFSTGIYKGTGLILHALFDPALAVRFEKDPAKQTEKPLIYIDPKEIYEDIIRENGGIVLGTETEEELREMAAEYES